LASRASRPGPSQQARLVATSPKRGWPREFPDTSQVALDVCMRSRPGGTEPRDITHVGSRVFDSTLRMLPRVTAPAPRSSCPLHQESFLTQARSLLTLEIIARAPRHHQYAKPTPALALQVDGVELPGTLVPSGLPLVVPTMQRADKTHSTNESSGTLGTRQVHRHTHTVC